MRLLQRISLFISIAVLLVSIVFLMMQANEISKLMAVIGTFLLAIGVGYIEELKTYRFTAWIIAVITLAMLYPQFLLSDLPVNLNHSDFRMVMIQLVMFGMGTQMSLKDFAQIKTMGRGVAIGLLCQFTIMPTVGFALTKMFSFEPEVAAGIVLIGSCSSGLASNVMVYLARANLTLSVTLTSVATLVAPIMTPFLMKTFAGTYVEVDFWAMCVTIIKIVIVPIGSAMLYDGMKTLSKGFRKRTYVAFGLASLWLLLSVVFGLGSGLKSGSMVFIELVNYLSGSVIFGVIYFHVLKFIPKLNDVMPVFSMIGIAYFVMILTAASQEKILSIGLLLFVVAVAHNTLGYVFGYGISRLFGLKQDSARTIALEVGLQNGGMAFGIADSLGKLTMGLAPVIFATWMNISGSLLANFWRRKETKD